MENVLEILKKMDTTTQTQRNKVLPTCLRPISYKFELNSKDTLASKGAAARLRCQPAEVEKKMDTTTRQFLKRNKVLPTCLPPISYKVELNSRDTLASKRAAAGMCCPPAEVKGSLYVQGTTKPLHKSETAQTWSTKQCLKHYPPSSHF